MSFRRIRANVRVMMEPRSDINEYIRALTASPRLRSQVVFHRVLKPVKARFDRPRAPMPSLLQNTLTSLGLSRLYSHQVEALEHIRSGRHVVTATPTASGKTLIYNLPVLEHILANPDAHALYLFPLKALAQDQLAALRRMEESLHGMGPLAEIYDGDTSSHVRAKIRKNPPPILLSNPDMLHLAILPFHGQWKAFFSGLKIVVVDEVHTYRGVMGSHMAQVFRRFQRICAFYGASPQYIFSSATVSNPAELAGQLTGLPVQPVLKSGAPQGRRHVVFLNPEAGPAQAAILLLKAALHRGLRTIVYCQSRKMTELIAIWAGSRSGQFRNLISAYRAGFLPEERRGIEARLSSGELLAVITTSALELGIDIGDLDLCILVGYPGSIMATWQRGGRVGRGGQDAAWILIAGEDALDQYFVRNPEEFLNRPPEAAVVNPENVSILAGHLECAAAELPMDIEEPFLRNPLVLGTALELEKDARLLRSEDGHTLYSSRKMPHRYVDLRGSGGRFAIVSVQTGESRGEIDEYRAFRETHPGAVYLHLGDTYLVEKLDLDNRIAHVARVRVDYYTRAQSRKETDIIEVLDEKIVGSARICLGRLRVTDQVTGFERWRIHAKKRLNVVPLDLPPRIFETEGIWICIPQRTLDQTVKRELHFMGGIHAVEHAAIGIVPLLVLCDRNDLGGISTPMHAQAGSAAVFIYDGVSGGAGLSRQAFARADELLSLTLQTIRTCGCENGCPSCVHSPKCGSGNRPIDKDAAVFVLESLRSGTAGSAHRREIIVRPSGVREDHKTVPERPGRFGVFDVETRNSWEEVGGWRNADRMRVSCVVLYDSGEDRFISFLEEQVDDFLKRLSAFDLVVGFNNRRFDNHVLSAYTSMDLGRLPTLDILEEIHRRLGYRLSLDHVAGETLGVPKSGSGIQALQWWKEGRIQEIIDYCTKDVELTRDLYLFGRDQGFLLFKNKAGNRVRIPVHWM